MSIFYFYEGMVRLPFFYLPVLYSTSKQRLLQRKKHLNITAFLQVRRRFFNSLILKVLWRLKYEGTTTLKESFMFKQRNCSGNTSEHGHFSFLRFTWYPRRRNVSEAFNLDFPLLFRNAEMPFFTLWKLKCT